MARLGIALLPIVAPLLLLTACSSSNPAADEVAPDEQQESLQVGDTFDGGDLSTQLIQVKNPLPPTGGVPPAEKGQQWVALKVKQCAAAEPEDEITSSYATEWFVRTPDGEEFNTNSGWGWPQPPFPQSVTIQPGECVQGWFVMPTTKGIQIERVIYRLFGDELQAEWNVGLK